MHDPFHPPTTPQTANPRLQACLARLKADKPVVLAGDLNVARLDLDCYNAGAKHLPKVPGCTPQEREAQTRWLAEEGWVDAFRLLHPGARGAYTYWNVKTGARAENKVCTCICVCMPEWWCFQETGWLLIG